MARRIEVELTSTREDGSWTWRAAGAKKPKGTLEASVLYQGAKVGDVIKAEAEYHVDGIEITELVPPKAKKQRTDLLERKTRGFREEELVSTHRAKREKRGRRNGRQDRSRGERRTPHSDEQPQRPKPKRLRPKHNHRNALLSEVGEEFRPIIEQLIKDGMPGVRKAIEKQNADAKAAGKPEIDATPVLTIAENNATKARRAEWLDRAEAALANAEELDLRDLRSVAVAGSNFSREQSDRELTQQLKETLDRRVEADHQQWTDDLRVAVDQGRVVRALRLSSRPVRAGAPLPSETANKLAVLTNDSLTPEVSQDRWATVLDALAFSPIRAAVVPIGIPAEPNEDLINEIKRLSDRITSIASLFGVDPATVSQRAKRRRSRRRKPETKGSEKKSGQPSNKKNQNPAATDEKTTSGKHVSRSPLSEQKPAPAETNPSASNSHATAESAVPAADVDNSPVVSEPAVPAADVDSPVVSEPAVDETQESAAPAADVEIVNSTGSVDISEEE